MAAAEVYWEVRGLMSAGAARRWVNGLAKVGAKLETREAVVLVSLTAEGVLTLRIAEPGQAHGSLMVMGRVARDPAGRLMFRPSHPGLGFGVEVGK